MMESKPIISKMDPGPILGTSTSASYTAMPTEIEVDAAKPKASVKVKPIRDNEIEGSSLGQLPPR